MQRKLVEHELYEPAEDTFFISKYLIDEYGQNALDIGTGSGYLAKILSSNFKKVVATDIDYKSLKSQKFKIENRICCYGANSLKCKFDLIICNMPYLPSDEVLDRTTDGGEEGIEVPLEIIRTVLDRLDKNGRFLFLTSSLANYQKLLNQTKKLGFELKIIAKKKLFFEELILIKAIKKNTS